MEAGLSVRRRYTADGRLADAENPGQVAYTFAVGSLLGDEGALRHSQAVATPKLDAAGFGPFSPLAGSGPDQLAFEFGETTQDGEHQPAMRRGGVGPGVAK